jgi:RNAse (barnase) inhibitor barstar
LSYRLDKPLLFDLNIELLNDCTWSCRGCHVNKSSQLPLNDEQGQKLVQLVKEFDYRGYELNFLNITPTDFMSASNTLEVLQNPYVKKLIHSFDYWFLTSTFLADDDSYQKEIQNLINADYKNTNLYFYVVMHTLKANDEKYKKSVVDKKNSYISKLKTNSSRQFVLYNWFDFPNPEIEALHRNYVATSDWYRQNFNANQDYVMSFARRKNLKSYKDEFVRSIDWLNDVIAADVPRDIEIELENRMSKIGETSYTAYDFLNRRYSYRNGEFFFVPFLVACIVNFDEMLKVPIKEWTVDEFERCEQDLVVSQYKSVTKKKACANCIHQAKCIERQIIHTLDALDYDGCIAPVRQYQEQFKNW